MCSPKAARVLTGEGIRRSSSLDRRSYRHYDKTDTIPASYLMKTLNLIKMCFMMENKITEKTHTRVSQRVTSQITIAKRIPTKQAALDRF